MYGLLGKSLKHSISPAIHSRFGNAQYRLYETDDLENFMLDKAFIGCNVTLPYKESVIPYLDEVDELAEKCHSVNTIINRRGYLTGYNTDYYGFKETLKYYNINPKEKNVLLLGNGGVSKTCEVVLKDLGACKITKLCRTVKQDNEIHFDEIDSVLKYDIIVNTTPVGMYPHNHDDLLIDLSMFTQVTHVIDLIYNPLRSKLILQAEELGIVGINGMYMLIMQAKKSHELFFNTTISTEKANQIFFQIYSKNINIVLVGLPLSGKSNYARKLSYKLQKPCFDSDKIIEDKLGISIPKIFENYGETYFRNEETYFVENIYKSHNMVISTGGGMIMDEQNMLKLKQNGFVVFLDKDPNEIASKTIYNRPLLVRSNDIFKLDKTRRPLYEKYQDFTINASINSQENVKMIEAKLYEYINR